MAALSGNQLILSVGSSSSPYTYTQVAGLQTTGFTYQNNIVDITTKDSNHYRTLLSNGGLKSISLSAAGIFTDAASEETLRANAMAGTANQYRLTLPNGDWISGQFIASNYQRDGANDDKESFSITLESSGQYTYTIN